MFEFTGLNMKSRIAFVFLGIAGILGNVFSVPLFFGVDFLFGSISTLIILYIYGIGWGLFAAVAASTYTYILWGHPYAVFIFTAEAAFVGFFVCRSQKNLLLSDGIFWLILGMPLVYLFYHMVMGMDLVSTALIMLKQSINGIFNALLAGFVINYLRSRRLGIIPVGLRKVPVRELLFNLMITIVLIPALVTTIIGGRGEMNKIEDNVTNHMITLSADVSRHLRSWYSQYLYATEGLAMLAQATSGRPSKALQKNTEIIKRVFPDFHNMYVADSTGTTIAFYPATNTKGESTIGLNFSDRDYFKKLKASLKPVVSKVFFGRGGVFEPIVTISAPIVKGGEFAGFALGALDLRRILRIIEPYRDTMQQHITITDPQNRIIASTVSSRKFGEMINLKDKRDFRFIRNSVYRLAPAENNLPKMTRFKKSFYVHESLVDENLGWRLIVEENVSIHQMQLFSQYVKILFFALSLAGGTFLFAYYFSQKFSRPLSDLAEMTANIPMSEAVAGQESTALKESSVAEIDMLLNNFKLMIRSLGQNFQEIKKRNIAVEEANENLKSKVNELEVMHKALRESEERFRTIFEAAENVSLIISDAKTVDPVILEFSPGAEKIFGYRRSEIIGGPGSLLNLPQGKAKIDQIFDPMMKWKGGFSGETILLRKSGEEFYALYSNYPLLDQTGNVYAYLAVIIDVSEQKKLEAQLQRAEKMEALGTLAGGVAHDLNNILSGIVGYPDLLLMQIPDDSPLRSPLKVVQDSGKKAAAIVQDLLTLARRGVLLNEVVNVNDVIYEYMNSLEFLKMKTDHPEVVVAVDYDADLLNISGSPHHLAKTVMNLINNAAEAMPNGGKISVSTRNQYVDRPFWRYESVKQGDYATFTVSDTGTGISLEDLEKIFEPFYTKKAMGRGGSGLGMTVVWGAVKDHHGYIDIQSDEGKGTSFTLFFPATRQEKLCAQIKPLVENYTGNGESILIVDDIREQREITLAMVNTLNYAAVNVSSGEAAIEHLRAHRVDLVILDMIMDPGMDGLDTYKEILKINPHQKAILVSGFSETERIREAQRLGAGAYIKKPFTLDTIGTALKAALEK